MSDLALPKAGETLYVWFLDYYVLIISHNEDDTITFRRSCSWREWPGSERLDTDEFRYRFLSFMEAGIVDPHWSSSVTNLITLADWIDASDRAHRDAWVRDEVRHRRANLDEDG